MHSVCRNEICLARMHRNPIERLLDLAVFGGFKQPITRDSLSKSESDCRARFGIDDVPHFRLAARNTFAIIRVNLNREPL